MVGSGVGSRRRTCATTRASVLRTSASVSAKQGVVPVGAHVASDSRDRSRSLAPISTTTRSAPRATSSCERPCVRSSRTSCGGAARSRRRWPGSPRGRSCGAAEVASCSRSPAQPQASADGTESPTPTTRRGRPGGRLDGVGGSGGRRGTGRVTGAAAEDVGPVEPARAAGRAGRPPPPPGHGEQGHRDGPAEEDDRPPPPRGTRRAWGQPRKPGIVCASQRSAPGMYGV